MEMQRELVTASFVKQVLEQETGDKYKLKAKGELVHHDGSLWFLHLSLGKSVGWIDHAYEKGGVVLLVTPVVYDVRRRMEYEYRALLGRKRLEKDLDAFENREVRAKYAEVVPRIVAFFDKADDLLADIKTTCSTRIRLVNNGGMVSARVELSESEVKEEKSIRENIRAMMEFEKQVSEWLKNQAV